MIEVWLVHKPFAPGWWHFPIYLSPRVAGRLERRYLRIGPIIISCGPRKGGSHDRSAVGV